ncbi:adenine phosphoribosyltransferase [bacterium]|nr:adenine phosphoribosyltransferase [bacterium]|tara:strand:- start:1601 stop:2119 length:519 start_codon:yes stop_codon:yes gene_type:complete
MLSRNLKKLIQSFPDFPKEGILFRDITPIFSDPRVHSELIKKISSYKFIRDSDAILAIDARGFLLGSAVSIELSKPLILARKPGKLPGELITHSYELEYGNNSLSIQKDSIAKYKSFSIIDDLLATGGTVECVSKILSSVGKEVAGLSVIIELNDLKARSRLPFDITSEVTY